MRPCTSRAAVTLSKCASGNKGTSTRGSFAGLMLAGLVASASVCGCTDRGDPLPVADITAEATAAFDAAGRYELRAKQLSTVQCVCVFGGDDTFVREGLESEAAVYQAYRGCSNADNATSYSPLRVPDDEALFVLIGDAGSGRRVELQRAQLIPPIHRAVNMHAPGCFRAARIVLSTASQPLQIFQHR